MKKTNMTCAAAVACVASLVLSACGGNDYSPPPTKTAVGVITGFGSVIVNGVRFDDSSATVTMDDATATRSRLRVGMVVQVQAQVRSDGTYAARTIRYNDCAEGPITAMNRVQNTVTVMGQTVELDDDTAFDGVTLRDMNAFAVGDHVEVSCLPDPARQRVRATRMERLGTFQNGVTEMELKGTVANLDATAHTFRIGDLTVSYGGVASGDVPAGLANGMTVEVGGKTLTNGTMVAQRLRDRDRDRISYPDGDGLVLEGYVSGFVSISDFKVSGQAVNAANAVVRNGTAADVRDGVRVEVEGTLTNNVLIASKLVIKRQSDVRVEAGLQSKNTTAGTLTLMGKSFLVTADTLLRDRLVNATQPSVVTLANLATADRLEVNAYRDSGGALVATRVERTAADTLVVVKGPADAKTPTVELTLAGIPVTTGANTRYRDATGELVDAATFFGAVAVPPAVPTLVHARGVVPSLSATTLDATRETSTAGEVEVVGP